ncbi:helix-turn-helix domain-containing protein [Streptomyces sp. 3MP-14]|uniref:Helix-turn-helix domain-containing protein n=1 Tax=Streptomyces mimosae TaxID=2586635 RepID=A0A5N6AGZ0_9ACTN|nr:MULTISPECIES: helix-turn-helix transcriptional regulator [Streptomyces]KAB8167069.1 helix-turn-helix domain-containing protein [Streptomyces mimosae]KAB8177010.1 helix-turn-helix domain-containing protein [Streptomyces sp. 3MP-14]
MTASASSAAQAAREAVSRRLRELRQDAGLTIVELASRCGWHHAKTSRIENTRSTPSTDDIRRWCRACSADDQADDIVAASRNASSMYTEWRRSMRTGLRQLQESYGELFEATETFRVYSTRIVPGILQTEGYAAALLRGIARFHRAPDDVDDAAAARVERSRIVHQPGHRFILVVEEAAMYYQLGNTEVMAGQLGYLLTAGALPAVSLGIVPASLADRPIRPLETFHVYDDLVAVELLTARVTVTQPSEVALYLRAFEELRSLAVYGADARALILRAIEALR